MSHKTSLRVWEHSQTQRAARCLMLALADFANDDGICWPGTALLSKKINESADYTDVIIKKCIDMGELAKHAGRGRGHPSRFAILCGLSSDAQNKLKGVLEKGYSSTPIAKRGTAKGVLIADKRGTISDTKYPTNGASGTTIPPISENEILHDPIHDGDGDGRTLAFLIDKGVGAAKEFAHLPYESMLLDWTNRTADQHSPALIVKAWRVNPPTESYHYERPERPVQSSHAADRRKPSERIGERPTLPPNLKLAGRRAAAESSD